MSDWLDAAVEVGCDWTAGPHGTGPDMCATHEDSWPCRVALDAAEQMTQDRSTESE